MEDEITSEKLEMLKFLYGYLIGEVNFLRERQEKIFTWSSNIFMALIGALLIIEPSKTPIWAFTIPSKIIASLAVIILILFSVRWQQRTRGDHGENRQTIRKIEELFHCHEEGYFDPNHKEFVLFPRRWKDPEYRKPRTFIKRLFAANFLSATVILGILTVAMVWIRS